MRSRALKLVAVLMLMSMVFAPFSGTPVQANPQVMAVTPMKHSLAVSENGIYIVRLADASLSTYQGGLAGLKATSPEATGARRLDTRTPESIAYLNYLGGKQSELLDKMAKVFGHPIEVVAQYKNVLNAVAVKIDHDEALSAFYLPDVSTVYADRVYQMETDIGPTLIGAPSIWSGDTTGDVATYGEGIVIGVIDSGINHAHPSFADIGADGYDHTNPYGSGIYVGYCVENPTFCNDKLIGAYDLTYYGSGGPEDEDGHGSHTASTSGGNFVDVEFDDGAGGTFTVRISGVAPHANLIAYRVCNDDGGCEGYGTISAVDHAIADGVSVLNYSISGSDDPWNDPVDLAFLDAYAAGIFVSASAGNAGPTASTVAKTGPWNAAVAASTHSRIIAHPLDVVTETESLLGLGAVEGTGPVLTEDLTAPILYGGDIDAANFEGCTAWTGTPFAGKIGMVQRGTCSFAIKVNNLTAAGAIGALVFNNAGGPPIVMGALEATTIPSMMISLEDGLNVVEMITGDPSANATMYVAQTFVYNDDWADIMASFSSRGPSQWEILKPDYAAPGVNVLAAVAAYDGDPVQFGFYQGTSMAAPHGSGSAALLVALHPDWSPAAIKSAIATTANPDVLDSDGVTPADPFDDGSGRIDLSKAAKVGIVFDETYENYVAADPYLGGEPRDLNQPSMVDYTCIGTCAWTRTITSVSDLKVLWEVSFETPAGMTLSIPIEDTTFWLDPGATKQLAITADVSAGTIDQYYFGNLILTPKEFSPILSSEAVNAEVMAAARIPVVAQLRMSALPDLVDIVTMETSGTQTVTDLQALIDIEELTVEVSGLAKGQNYDIVVSQDPTNGDPFDDLSQVYWTTVSVPLKTLRFVAEVVESAALDVDLFVGTGATPTAETVVCSSATSVWAEYCELTEPAKGTYWVLVQNWQGSDLQPDAIKAVTGLVVEEDAGNLTVTGPIFVPAQDFFNIDINWDEPSMLPGDFWYALFTLGTEQSQAGNLGNVRVNLDFIGDTFDVDLAPATQDGYGDQGATVPYTLTVTNLGTTTDTVTLAAEGNTWVVDLPVTSFELASGASADFAVSVTVPADALDGEMDTATIVATSTADPLVTASALVNTYANPFFDIDLVPAADAKIGVPDETVVYTLTLSNLGNAHDVVTLVPSGFLWDVILSTTSVDLMPGESVDITVEVTVPTDALDGEVDVVTITASSAGGDVATSVLTTTALVEPVTTNYFTYLPIAFKNPAE